jgi:glucose-fructose oxidoreductase
MQPAYEYAEPLVVEITVDGKTTKKRGRKGDQFAPELIYFSDCVRKNRPPEPSAEEGAQDVRIIEALYESAATARPVRLDAFRGDAAPARRQAIFRPPVGTPMTVNTEPPHE